MAQISKSRHSFLQETHCATKKDSEKWSKEWGKKCFWNLGTSRSCGTGILFGKKISIENTKIIKEEKGRYQLVELNYDGFQKSILLLNSYAPNAAVERKQYFNNIKQTVESFAKDKIIIFGGDHNCTLHNDLDRLNCCQSNDAGREEISEIISSLNLEDVWRSCL